MTLGSFFISFSNIYRKMLKFLFKRIQQSVLKIKNLNIKFFCLKFWQHYNKSWLARCARYLTTLYRVLISAQCVIFSETMTNLVWHGMWDFDKLWQVLTGTLCEICWPKFWQILLGTACEILDTYVGRPCILF